MTKGDANPTDDNWLFSKAKGLSSKDLVGKMEIRLPKLGLPVLAVQETLLGKVRTFVDVISSSISLFYIHRHC